MQPPGGPGLHSLTSGSMANSCLATQGSASALHHSSHLLRRALHSASSPIHWHQVPRLQLRTGAALPSPPPPSLSCSVPGSQLAAPLWKGHVCPFCTYNPLPLGGPSHPCANRQVSPWSLKLPCLRPGLQCCRERRSGWGQVCTGKGPGLSAGHSPQECPGAALSGTPRHTIQHPRSLHSPQRSPAPLPGLSNPACSRLSVGCPAASGGPCSVLAWKGAWSSPSQSGACSPCPLETSLFVPLSPICIIKQLETQLANAAPPLGEAQAARSKSSFCLTAWGYSHVNTSWSPGNLYPLHFNPTSSPCVQCH